MSDSTLPPPPIAARKPYSFTRHGRTVEDPWAWLRDPGYPKVEDPEVLDYLNEENAYFEAVMAPHRPLNEHRPWRRPIVTADSVPALASMR